MAPSERKEPGLGTPKSGSGSDDADDFLNLIPDRLAPRAGRGEDGDAFGHVTDDNERDHVEPIMGPAPSRLRLDDDEADPQPTRTRLSAAADHDDGGEPEDDEDYDDEPESRSNGSRGVMIAVVAGAIVAGVAGWYLFLRGDDPQEVAGVQAPVIAADSEPYKVRPADPGGMQVPNTDKMVYDRLGQNTQGGGVENLLAQPPAPTAPPPPAGPGDVYPGETLTGEPMPEQDVAVAPTPQPLPGVAAAPAPSAPVVQPPQTLTPPPAAQPAPAPVAAAPAPRPAAPTPAPAPAPAPQVAALPPAAAPSAPAVTAPVGGGAMMVQLAALKDEASARQAWSKAVAANGDLLGNLSLDIQRADLGDKGVFYRVRAKGLRTADEAKGLCEKLAARKVGCIVVR